MLSKRELEEIEKAVKPTLMPVQTNERPWYKRIWERYDLIIIWTVSFISCWIVTYQVAKYLLGS